MRNLVCRWRGHRWSICRDACDRCGVTALELYVGVQPAPTWDDVGDAYWRGIQDGRKLDRRRAYRLGLLRMHRELMVILEGGRRVRRARTVEDTGAGAP